MALREVQSLRKLRHPNIVKLKEVVREHDILHMVTHYPILPNALPNAPPLPHLSS